MKLSILQIIKEEVENLTNKNLNQNFWKWFGNSKIVNSDGTPKVMYHGTPHDFDVFKAGENDAEQQKVPNHLKFAVRKVSPIFLSDDPKFAEYFSEKQHKELIGLNNISQGSIMPLYVKAENPWNYENPTHVNELITAINKQWGDAPSKWNLKFGDWIEIEKYIPQIKDLGFDGFYIKEIGQQTVAVFSPTQIKSATGNNGEYSLNNSDITKENLEQIIKEEIENFFNDTQPDGQPGMADNLYNKLAGTSAQKSQVSTSKISGELIGQVYKQWDTPLEIPIPVYKNPTNLMGFSNGTRGILLYNGDLYLGLTYNALHKNILDLLAKKNIIPYAKILDYNTIFPKEFIAITRVMHTDNFSESSEYSKVQFPEYYKQIFNNANQKHPFKFMPLPRTGNVEEIESPLDPNLQVSYTPDGYNHNILDEKTEEKYYLSTNKTGRGEKPVKLTKTQIENNWDLGEISWFDVPLGEYLEESYIGDVWETRTEKIQCTEIH